MKFYFKLVLEVMELEHFGMKYFRIFRTKCNEIKDQAELNKFFRSFIGLENMDSTWFLEILWETVY